MRCIDVERNQTYTKAEAIRIVTSCARVYEEELLNKSLLFVCQDKHKRISYYEFFFYDRNFLHLTGFKLVDNSARSAKDFFYKCLSHKISQNDFNFSVDGTTHLKLTILPYLLKKNLSADTIGDFSSQRPKLYTEKLAGNTKGCIGFCTDDVTGNYTPNTILKEDIRDNIGKHTRVIIAYRKSINDDMYSEITYTAKKIEWDKILFSKEYSYLPKPEPALT